MGRCFAGPELQSPSGGDHHMEADLAQTARAYVETFDVPGDIAKERACPIDLVHLSRQTFGERDLEAELLRLFDRQSAQILARLSEGAQGRWRADLAHTLKGSARAVGAFDVAAAAEAYEAVASAGGADETALAALASSISAAHTAIGDLLAG